jgi:hypothetical protein
MKRMARHYSCYVVDIGIPGMAISRLWIRANYFNFFQDYFNDYAKPMDRVPSAVLTGQPGIGESSCIALLSIREGGSLHITVKLETRRPPLHRLDFCRFCENRDGVPPRLIPHGTLLFVIYSTSPAVDRWSRMNKTTQEIGYAYQP